MTLLEKLKRRAASAYRCYQEAPANEKRRCLEEYQRVYATYRKQKLIIEEAPSEGFAKIHSRGVSIPAGGMNNEIPR